MAFQSLSSHASLSSTSAGNAFCGQTSRLLPTQSLKISQPRPQGLVIRCKGFIRGEDREKYEGVQNLGPDLWNRTYYPKLADHVNNEKQWFVVDAKDMRLGRLASTIAFHIRGKHLPTYTPSVDMGAFVVVVNADKVGVTGNKRSDKLYHRHSGRPGGMKIETFDQLIVRIPERIVEHAVRGMLPKGRLGRQLFTHLKVYKGSDHPHEAQKPVPLPIHDKRIMMP